ncbi:unnamed protein product [Moneuplotes crassus]|uniref:Uncharacterized protein n=1 Tax=Euplotes crassus TaxID=5936 RepID=A0AAD1UMS0_EUPCR|nr:unnamed protein product [Moneuplotes crassus]
MNKEDAMNQIEIAYEQINDKNNGYQFDTRKRKLDLGLKSCRKPPSLSQSSPLGYFETVKGISEYKTPKKTLKRTEIDFTRTSPKTIYDSKTYETTSASSGFQFSQTKDDRSALIRKSIDSVSRGLFKDKEEPERVKYQPVFSSPSPGLYSNTEKLSSLNYQHDMRSRYKYRQSYTRDNPYQRSSDYLKDYTPLFSSNSSKYYSRY